MKHVSSIRSPYMSIFISFIAQKLGLVEIAYTVAKLGENIDWNLQRTNYASAVANSRHHRRHDISVRTFSNGNDDAYDGEIDDTLNDALLFKASPENDGAYKGGMDNKVIEDVATGGNDDAYSGGIDDTLGIVSFPLESVEAGNDDAYGGKMDDTLDVIAPESSKTILGVLGNDDAYEGRVDDTLLGVAALEPSFNHHGIEGGQINVQPYLRYGRHRRLQENDIDGDVFDGYEYDQGACPNAGSLDVPCAPSNLSSICNKYDDVNGSFEECLEACKPAFCCIHDAPRESNYLSPNCNTDENCPQYSYCYIVWWKLHDTVGPAPFMRVDQDDKFYEGAEDLIDVDGGVEDPFMTQVLLHHFDGIDQVIEDGTVDNEFDADRIFLDEEYWMYPESKKVDVND